MDEEGMKCYTVHERVEVGLKLYDDPATGVHVALGPERRGRFPVSPRLHDRFHEALAAVKGLADTGLTEAADIHRQGWLVVNRADVESTEIGSVLIEEREDSPRRRALVLVDTAPGVGGSLIYGARSYDEKINGRDDWARVGKRYHPFPPTGIEVVAEYETAKLLVMLPGSGFVLKRDGDLAGASPRLTVYWHGTKLRVTDFEAVTRTLRTQRRAA